MLRFPISSTSWANSNIGLAGCPRAEQSAVRALTMRRRTFGPGHPLVATSMNNLAEVLFAESRYREAEQYFRGAVALAEQETPPDPERLGKFLANLGKALTARGRDAEASRHLGRALAIWTRLGIPSEEAATLGMLGVLKRQRGEYNEAEQLFRHALDRLPPGHPNASTARIDLAEVLLLRKRYEESDHQFSLAISQLEARLGREHQIGRPRLPYIPVCCGRRTGRPMPRRYSSRRTVYGRRTPARMGRAGSWMRGSDDKRLAESGRPPVPRAALRG
jgi:tetratricopeptide (TPR) repeat protein